MIGDLLSFYCSTGLIFVTVIGHNENPDAQEFNWSKPFIFVEERDNVELYIFVDCLKNVYTAMMYKGNKLRGARAILNDNRRPWKLEGKKYQI